MTPDRPAQVTRSPRWNVRPNWALICWKLFVGFAWIIPGSFTGTGQGQITPLFTILSTLPFVINAWSLFSDDAMKSGRGPRRVDAGRWSQEKARTRRAKRPDQEPKGWAARQSSSGHNWDAPRKSPHKAGKGSQGRRNRARQLPGGNLRRCRGGGCRSAPHALRA